MYFISSFEELQILLVMGSAHRAIETNVKDQDTESLGGKQKWVPPSKALQHDLSLPVPVISLILKVL